MSARPFCRLICALMAACLMLCACAQGAAGAATPEQAAAATPAPTKPKATAHNTAHTTATGETADGVPTVLPESKDAGRDYLDGTLFIGDSNTARYMMYADDTGKAFTTVDNTIGVVSMSATAITTLKCERFKGYNGAYTIPDAVAMLKPQRIIIGFGTNDLSNGSTANYIEKYGKGLAAIAAAWEYADIIVCAVPPLDYQRENTRLTMTQVDEFNEALTTLCEEEGYHFLNTAEVLKDASSGWAKKDYTLSDGVHLSKTAVTALFDYIRTHALTTPDRRPKDLGTIPKPDGVPPGLIQKDPIAVRGAKVPVEFVAGQGGSLQGSTSQNVKKGGTCATVTAVPNTGWKFDYWTASIGSAGGGASLTFTVPGNADANGVIITAHFTPAEHEHDYVEVEGTRVAPTCQQEGSAEYKCSICGEVTEKTLSKLDHSPKTNSDGSVVCSVCGTVLQQHTHDFSVFVSTTATCGQDGQTTWKCSGCGQTTVVNAQATGKHDWVKIGHQDATPDQKGYNIYQCQNCKSTKNDDYYEYVPPKTETPSTGDNNGNENDQDNVQGGDENQNEGQGNNQEGGQESSQGSGEGAGGDSGSSGGDGAGGNAGDGGTTGNDSDDPEPDSDVSPQNTDA